MEISGGDVLLNVFQEQGIEYIFSSPGTEWVSVWEGLARRYQQGERSVKYISCRHENLAVSMATGYANVTGRLPAVLLHASVGPLQGAIAIRAAYQSRTPMIICTADTSGCSPCQDGKDWGGHWLSSLADVGGALPMLSPYVKWANAVISREALLDSLYRGCRMARTRPRGPVFITIAKELMLQTFADAKILKCSLPAPPAGPCAADLEQVAEQLINSRLPIILTEHAGKQPENVTKLVELAETLAAPVFECMSPSFFNFPKTHPLHMGYSPVEALNEADTVLVVGATSPWHPPADFPRNGTKVIVLDEDPLKEQLPYWGYSVDQLLAADISAWLTVLVDLVRERVRDKDQKKRILRERFEKWQALHALSVGQWEQEAVAAQAKRPISPKWFFYQLNRLLPDESSIVEECITHKPFINRYLTRHRGFFKTSGGGLGIGMGQALGTKFADPQKPVFFLVGDGSFNYNPALAAFGLCQEYQLPICTIVLNNGGYMAMKRSHRGNYPEGWAVRSQTYLGAAITPSPDYRQIAQAFDGYGARIETPEDIEPVLKQAVQQLSAGKSVLLDVVLD